MTICVDGPLKGHTFVIDNPDWIPRDREVSLGRARLPERAKTVHIYWILPSGVRATYQRSIPISEHLSPDGR